MKTNISETKIFSPNSIEELDRIVRQYRDKITFVAGATDIMVDSERWESVDYIIDFSAIPEISENIEEKKDGIYIGAALPVSAIMREKIIRNEFPLIIDPCKLLGSVQIQNRATLGGNIANASPAGDTIPVLNVYDSKLLIGPRYEGEFKIISIDDIMKYPGETLLKEGEYIYQIYLPFQEKRGQFKYFRKVGQRYAVAISKVSLAVLGWMENEKFSDIRICAGSVSPQVKRAVRTEKFLKNKKLSKETINAAAAVLKEEVKPITDIRSTANYRRDICGALLKEALFS